MNNLNLCHHLISASTLFILCFLLLGNYSYGQCNIHSNFTEIVQHLNENSDNYYDVQVTIINPGKNGGKSHRYSAFSQTNTLENQNICEEGLKMTKQKIYFSDRNFFDKSRPDIQSFKFNVVNNSVDITLNTWGDGTYTVNNLTKRGRLIYAVDQYGKMIVFNFKKDYFFLH